MQIIKMPLSELVYPEKNMRIHTENQIQEFIRSIKMFGQIRPVVIDENNVILAGNGLVQALNRAGITEADVYKIANLTENQKKKLMIADNKIFSLGIENLDTLNTFLEELQGDLDIPGFDEEILKTMVADGDEVTQKIAEYGVLNTAEIEQIRQTPIRKDESPAPITTSTSDDTDEEEITEQEPADVRKFVVCPKCGEKIWL